MKILALDLATKTGWAFWDGTRIESGMQDFTKQRGESNGMLFVKFNRWLGEFSRTGNRPELIVYEQTFAAFGKGGGGFMTEISIGLITRVQEFCVVHGIDHSALHNATLKKWATGAGNAKKEAMKLEASRRAGRTISDDNEADAYLLALWAKEKLAA